MNNKLSTHTILEKRSKDKIVLNCLIISKIDESYKVSFQYRLRIILSPK